MVHVDRVDQLLAYALAAAGAEDHGRRELGPIHLIKYVYLADLAYAQWHNGETYTGIPWRFYHFGPWEQQVNERIKPVVVRTGAFERVIRSQVGDDTVRWRLEDEELLNEIGRGLPLAISLAIRSAVHQFGDNTADLLNHVYTTPPMLHAAPNQRLDFALAVLPPVDNQATQSGEELTLSEKAKKRRRADFKALGERMRQTLAERRQKQQQTPQQAFPPPRYDKAFFEGVEWLDSLAGDPIQPGRGLLRVSDEVWTSDARTKGKLPK